MTERWKKMIRIAGELVGGGVKVSVSSEAEARLVQEEMAGRCRFVADCGCGKFHLVGSDGPALWRAAQKHAIETGHKAFGHFLFGGGK
jgi:hypothetical protein